MKRKTQALLLVMLVLVAAFVLVTKIYLETIDCSSLGRRQLVMTFDEDQDTVGKESIDGGGKHLKDSKARKSLSLLHDVKAANRGRPEQKAPKRLAGRRKIIGNQRQDPFKSQKQDAALRNRVVVIPEGKLATFTRRPSEFRSPLTADMTLKEMAQLAEVVCELHLNALGNCKKGEVLTACVARIGARNLEMILPARCRDSPYFQRLALADTRAASAEVWTKLNRTSVYNEQVISTRDPRPRFVPPSDRPPHAFKTGPRVCQSAWSKIPGCAMFPIGFAVPEKSIVKRVSRVKMFDFLPLLPRWYPMPGTLGYSLDVQDEELSRILYRHSFFAYTHRRGGWDVPRHYEAISQGSLPYFPDILQCDKFCLTAFPKELVASVLKLPGVQHIGHIKDAAEGVSNRYFVKEPGVEFHNNKLPRVLNFQAQGDINWKLFNTSLYFELAENLLEYTRKFLTTKSLVTYMLETIGKEEPRNVLIITAPGFHMLTESVLHGFYDLGINYTIAVEDSISDGGSPGNKDKDSLHHKGPTPQLVETDAPLSEAQLEDKRELLSTAHGRGFVLGFRRLDPNPSISIKDAQKRIRSVEFDLILYTHTVHPGSDSQGQLLKDRPLWGDVSAVYTASDIAFLDLNDDVYFDPTPVSVELCGKGTIFMRSLHDKDC